MVGSPAAARPVRCPPYGVVVYSTAHSSHCLHWSMSYDLHVASVMRCNASATPGSSSTAGNAFMAALHSFNTGSTESESMARIGSIDW